MWLTLSRSSSPAPSTRSPLSHAAWLSMPRHPPCAAAHGRVNIMLLGAPRDFRSTWSPTWSPTTNRDYIHATALRCTGTRCSALCGHTVKRRDRNNVAAHGVAAQCLGAQCSAVIGRAVKASHSVLAHGVAAQGEAPRLGTQSSAPTAALCPCHVRCFGCFDLVHRGSSLCLWEDTKSAGKVRLEELVGKSAFSLWAG